MRLSWTTESSSCLTVMTLVGLLSAATGLSLAGDGCEVGAGATGGARTHRPIRYHYQGVLMQRVIIAPHMKCNARCAHCCVSSHPKDERHLEDATVVRLIDEAIASPSIKIVAFTGGEALLRKSLHTGADETFETSWQTKHDRFKWILGDHGSERQGSSSRIGRRWRPNYHDQC